MTQFRGTSFGESEAEKEEKKAAVQQAIDEKKIADAKAKKDADAKVKKEEPKPEPPRRNRVTVLRDLVEDLESGKSISDDQRRAFQELNRRLTRALAK